MIYILLFVLFLQIGIFCICWHFMYELTSVRVETQMIWQYAVNFLARYCAEHPEYGEHVFPESWEKIKKGEIDEHD